MHKSAVNAFRPQTQTVSVYARHSAEYGKKNDPRCKRCKTLSAFTCSET
jgi:hypothetical protein